MKWLEYIYEFRVRFSDTDAYGIVHHSNHYRYFEEARYEFSKEVLKLYDDDSCTRFRFPVILSECTYKNPLKYNMKKYFVKLKFRVLENVKIEFLYEVIGTPKNKIFAKGKTVHAIVDEKNKLCLNLPQCFNDLLGGDI